MDLNSLKVNNSPLTLTFCCEGKVMEILYFCAPDDNSLLGVV